MVTVAKFLSFIVFLGLKLSEWMCCWYIGWFCLFGLALVEERGSEVWCMYVCDSNIFSASVTQNYLYYYYSIINYTTFHCFCVTFFPPLMTFKFKYLRYFGCEYIVKLNYLTRIKEKGIFFVFVSLESICTCVSVSYSFILDEREKTNFL